MSEPKLTYTLCRYLTDTDAVMRRNAVYYEDPKYDECLWEEVIITTTDIFEMSLPDLGKSELRKRALPPRQMALLED